MRMTIAVFVLVVGAVSCGGDGGGTGTPAATSGVDPSKIWTGLTTAEKGALCDWAASLYGGYGKTIDCHNGLTVGSNANQQACVASLPATCAATVDEIEECTKQAMCPDPTVGLSCLLTACQYRRPASDPLIGCAPMEGRFVDLEIRYTHLERQYAELSQAVF